MEKLYQFLRNQIRDGFFNAHLLNVKDVVDPIVEAIDRKKYETLKPEEVSSPIVEKLQELQDALPEMPKERPLLYKSV